MNHLLSKSRYIRGLQCIKALYLDTFCPNLARVSYETRQKFVAGRSFEKTFKDTFPGGIDISQQLKGQIGRYAILTSELLQRVGEVSLFEAGFCYDGVLVLADVLHKSADGTIDIYEVKNTSHISSVIRNDVYVQYYVISHCIDKLHRFKVVYRGDSNEAASAPDFCYEDLTEESRLQQEAVSKNIERFKEVLQGMEPNLDMGIQCDTPYECPYKQYCRGDMAGQVSIKI